MHGLHGFFAAHGLQGFAAAHGLHGLQGVLAAHGLHGLQGSLVAHGLQGLHAAICTEVSAAFTAAVGSATAEVARVATLRATTVFFSIMSSQFDGAGTADAIVLRGKTPPATQCRRLA